MSLLSYRRQLAESVAGQLCRGSVLQQQRVSGAGVSVAAAGQWCRGQRCSISRSVVQGSVVQQQQVSGAASAGRWCRGQW